MLLALWLMWLRFPTTLTECKKWRIGKQLQCLPKFDFPASSCRILCNCNNMASLSLWHVDTRLSDLISQSENALMSGYVQYTYSTYYHIVFSVSLGTLYKQNLKVKSWSYPSSCSDTFMVNHWSSPSHGFMRHTGSDWHEWNSREYIHACLQINMILNKCINWYFQ